MNDHFPKYKAAGVQMAAVWGDRDATTDKVCALAEEARAQGAELIVFPEVIIPGSPHWIWSSPEDYDRYVELYKNSVDIPGKTTQKLCETAKKIQAFLIVGVNERQGKVLYNTMLFIDRNGNLLGAHRKLMGTYVEKIIWAMGGGDSLEVFDTELGVIGGLICRENLSNLSRHVLASLGEQVHAGIWLAGSARRGPHFSKCMEAACITHALSSPAYVVGVQACASEREIEMFALKGPGGWSAIISPQGEIVAGPLPEGEGIVVGEIDLESSIRAYPRRDETGYHGRPDIFRVLVNREPYTQEVCEFSLRREPI
jgi:nitrilase